MVIKNGKATGVKIAYVGGGSRGWAWGLMSDLAAEESMNGTVCLYDIDFQAAKDNETIGNKIKETEGVKSVWEYVACPTLEEALTGADFVVISILPGTFDEMQSDVHTPEKYGIYQSVGDTTGPGGIVRALRTVPMFVTIAEAIRSYCPDAWVINYTNPMTLCVRTLYEVFPQIKAFGCCHEVFGTQKLLTEALEDIAGIKDVKRNEIKTNVLGVNHFTWLDSATYNNQDIFPIYAEFAEKYAKTGFAKTDNNWMNSHFACNHRVKFDLFRRYGLIAAAGDRHLAEFCPGNWYLQNPDVAHSWGYGLTPVSWRKEELLQRRARSARLVSGEEKFKLNETGEEGVQQMRALLGLTTLVTNVNMPNFGQQEGLPYGAVVETNAVFSGDSVTPIMAGGLPAEVLSLVSRVSNNQETIIEGIFCKDKDLILDAFLNDPLVTCSMEDAKKLYQEMVENTKKYLEGWEL
ncbi:MAG: alpha-glucosidase/alpha-galactosidase [Firmicutes bacterium]|nr:alpha-glucosidase/alpha-galactosidase [Bacillota bacterium]